MRSKLTRVIAVAGVIASVAFCSSILTPRREKGGSIYLNLNLLVSRKLTTAGGPADVIGALEGKVQKVLGFFMEDKGVHPPAGLYLKAQSRRFQLRARSCSISQLQHDAYSLERRFYCCVLRISFCPEGYQSSRLGGAGKYDERIHKGL